MNSFKRNDRFDRDRDRGGRDSRKPTVMHQATCAECGKKCEVPFRPTGDRPVYCSSCFDTQGGSNSGRGGDRKSFGDRGDRGDRPKFQVVCDECGKNCEVPFRPTAGKPVYCDSCFGKSGSSSRERCSESPRSDFSGDQLANINAKLDKLIALFSAAEATMTEEKEIVKKEVIKNEVAPKKEATASAKAMAVNEEKKVAKKAKPAEKKKTAVKKATKKKK
jgi:CxxC-x17-CxxC domain-containing protein